jgi:hypothetical protein
MLSLRSKGGEGPTEARECPMRVVKVVRMVRVEKLLSK